MRRSRPFLDAAGRVSRPVDRPADREAMYAAGEDRWDLGSAPPPLAAVLGRGEVEPSGRALVPGCGRGHDARLLAERGSRIPARLCSTPPASRSGVTRRPGPGRLPCGRVALEGRMAAHLRAGSFPAPPVTEPSDDPSFPLAPETSAPAVSPEDPFLGARVGQCWIVAKLGEGGFGTVYRAIDETRKHPVAIKLVKPERAGNEEVVRKFLRGAIAAAQVEHRNVVRIHRIGRDENFKLHYIVMEHLRGRTLQALLDERGQLPWAEVLPWMSQVADGLHAAHEKSIIHRDVKPDNLMLAQDGTVKVTDLGLARMVSKEAKTTRVMGTPHFMAPEQFEGKGMDRRTDIFGFGICLYYLLSHQFPYEGKNSMQIVFAILTTQPKPLPTACPAVPERLWEIVKKMISRYPAERYATMLEVKQALEAFAAAPGVPAA